MSSGNKSINGIRSGTAPAERTVGEGRTRGSRK